MGHPADLMQSPSARTDASLCAEQAIFTSIRSPMGEGYRIIAASPGVRSDEKAEMTQRSPSHGSLCETSLSATGLLSYPLKSGRYCVACSRYAGTEHTARGGQRVYTHLILLDDESYRHFDLNPARIQAAVVRAVGETLTLKPAALDPVLLAIQSTALPETYATYTPIDVICRMAAALLEDKRTVVNGSDPATEILDKTLFILPFSVRQRLSASVGLNFSLSRHIQLSVIHGNTSETQRAIRGQGIEWLDLQAPTPPTQASPFDPWLGLVRRWWNEQRFDDIRRLTSQLTFDATPEYLKRIAEVCNDSDAVRAADESGLAGLAHKYIRFDIQNALEQRLIEQVIEAASRRTAELRAELPQCRS